MTRKHDNAMTLAEPLMAHMAAGSSDALFGFIAEFSADLERVVAGILVSLHRRDIARSPNEVSSLGLSAALVIFQRAGGWRADGSLPWVWAYRSIRAEVVTQIGHPTVEYDQRVHHVAGDGAVGAGDVDLRDMARRHMPIAAWLQAVESVASDRDQAVHLEYQVQKHLGDPSPANTVAPMFDLSPANVRQIDRRVRTKLGQRQRNHYAAISWVGQRCH